jgi:hypothetical protein
MMKNCLIAAALLSLLVMVACAKGGNGVVPPPITVAVKSSVAGIYPTESVMLTATVAGSTNTAVTWSLSGSGTLTPASPTTATYVASSIAGSQATVTATSVADTSITGQLQVTIVDITTEVTPAAVSPATLSVGKTLTQQFTAITVPDAAPQTFTWTCTASGVPCANFVSNTSGLATYTAQDNCSGSCIQISAASTLDPTGCAANPKNCSVAKASLVNSRLNGTYAFRFSGYDSSNNATAMVGTFTASNGTVASGAEDEFTSNGWATHPITGGSYVPTSTDTKNSNNAGTLTLATGTFPNKFQAVLDGNGDIEMIESDGQGTGSGIAETASAFNSTTDQTFAFGFTGVDASGNRVGYAGLMPFDGNGNITGGLIDVNDNGDNTNSVCGSAPCTVTGTYQQNGNGSWRLALTSPITMKFDFFVASGGAGAGNPLTLFAISADSSGANPTVSGTMVLQDSTKTYNNTAFDGLSVSALTGTGAGGTNANVSLTAASTDGDGVFAGQFDQNNAGTIVSVPGTAPFSYTYAAVGTGGRYTFQMLGNPAASPVVAPLPFILYASGANRGFLLDQSSSSVMTGTMNPQGKDGGGFGNSELPGTYAAATTSSADSAVSPIAANLLLTFPGGGVYSVSGTRYPGPQTLVGLYNLSNIGDGTGTITLTAPSAQSYVIYAVDSTGCNIAQSFVCTIQDFLMMDVDTANTNASIIFAQQ